MPDKKILKVLKIILLLSLLVFGLLYIGLNKDNCDACDFNGKGIKKFMQTYSEECFGQTDYLEVNLSNFDGQENKD